MSGKKSSSRRDIDSHFSFIEIFKSFLAQHSLYKFFRILRPILLVIFGLPLKSEVVLALLLFHITELMSS
jgi:hypothetical protein